MGLIEAFVVLEPPKLKILYSKSISLPDATGTLYEKEDGACSLVVKAKRGAIVNVETPSCNEEGALLDFVQKLTFKRFNERLES